MRGGVYLQEIKNELPQLLPFGIMLFPLIAGISLGKFYMFKGKKWPIFVIPVGLGTLVIIGFTVHCFATAFELGLLACAIIPPILGSVTIIPYLITSLAVYYLSQGFSLKKLLKVGLGVSLVILVIALISFIIHQDATRYAKIYQSSDIQEKDVELCKRKPLILQEPDYLVSYCITEVAIKLKDESICDKYLSDRDERRRCFFDVAQVKQDPSVCAKIGENEVEGIRKWRDMCISKLAIEKLDIELCQQAKTDLDICMAAIAVRTGNVSLCENDTDKDRCIEVVLEENIDKTTLNKFKKALLEQRELDLKSFATEKSTASISARGVNPIVIVDFDDVHENYQEENRTIDIIAEKKNMNSRLQNFFVFVVEKGSWKLDVLESIKKNSRYTNALSNWKNYEGILD